MNKAKQCSDWDAPVLLFVGTFHFQASILLRPEHPAVNELLTGESLITTDIDLTTGEAVSDSYLSTHGDKAVFQNERMEAARRSISGVLLAGFGTSPTNYCGVLHPEAVRPFDMDLLGSVRFCQLDLDRQAQQVSVRWN